MDQETRMMFEKLFDSIENMEISLKKEIGEIKGEIAEIKGEIKEIKAEQTRMNERLDVLGQMYGMHDLAIKTLQAKKII